MNFPLILKLYASPLKLDKRRYSALRQPVRLRSISPSYALIYTNRLELGLDMTDGEDWA